MTNNSIFQSELAKIAGLKNQLDSYLTAIEYNRTVVKILSKDATSKTIAINEIDCEVDAILRDFDSMFSQNYKVLPTQTVLAELETIEQEYYNNIFEPKQRMQVSFTCGSRLNPQETLAKYIAKSSVYKEFKVRRTWLPEPSPAI